MISVPSAQASLISFNDINTPYSDLRVNTILDKMKAHLPHGFSEVVPFSFLDRSVCVESRQKYAKCDECGTSYFLTVTCKKRSCPACQASRAIRLFKYNEPLVEDWEHGALHVLEVKASDKSLWYIQVPFFIYFDTLTNVNVPSISEGYLATRDRYLTSYIQRLTRRGYVSDYGFICKEMTWNPNTGYHYHFHILRYGPRVDFKVFNPSHEWKSITKDSFMVKVLDSFGPRWDRKAMQFVNDGNKRALRYILKYVCKAQPHGNGMDLYYSITAKKRTFQAFGKRFLCFCPGCVANRDLLRDKRKLNRHASLRSSERHQCEKRGLKLPLICSECYSDLRRSQFGFYSSVVFDSPFGEVSAMKQISYVKIRHYIWLKSQHKVVSADVQCELTREGLLLARVRSLLCQKHNAAAVEEVLTDDDLFFLLRGGSLIQVRSDQYIEGR